MGYNDSKLTPTSMQIYNGVESKVDGTIQLPMTRGEEPNEATKMLNFLVIKATYSYNAILVELDFMHSRLLPPRIT